MPTMEDALAARAHETATAIAEAKDHCDPVAWTRILEQALLDEDIDDLARTVWRGGDIMTLESDPIRPQEAGLFQSFLADYKEWKRMQLGLFRAGTFLNWRKAATIGGQLQQITGMLGGYHYWVILMLAAEIMRRLYHRSRTAAEEKNDEGWDLHDLGRHAEALRCHDEAIRLSPKFALAWVNKGIALKNLRRFDEARSCYDMVIRSVDPEFKKAWYNKATAILAQMQASGTMVQADLVDIVACLQKATEIDPEYDLARTLMNSLQAVMG